MNNPHNNNLKQYLPIIYVLLIFFVILLIGLVFLSIPRIYDTFYGDKIVQQHIKEIIGNKTNHAEISASLLTWIHENVIYPNSQNMVKILGMDIGFYSIHNKTRYFFRDSPASWTIRTQMGRCGEDAVYFAQIMNKLGYRSRVIRPVGWDHSWAEYYTVDGMQVVLDPSSNQLITDKLAWVSGKNVTKVESYEIKGKKEDISPEYGINNTGVKK